jgi:Putative adhesin
MQRTFCVTASSATAALLALAGLARADVVDTRELEETVPVTAGQPLVVIVKNITGSVRVTGHDSDRVEMHATETVRGDLQADIERARAELGLRTESEPGRVAFRVRRLGANGEAIEDGDCDCHNRRWDEGYNVEYDIELRVPRGATLDLATVTDGDVTVEGVSGDFAVANVNGGVRLTGLVGSGSVKTVNGDVEARFARAPGETTSFRTVNGKLDVTFPENLSADLEFATMQGDVFTDFEVAALTPEPTVSRDDNRGRFVMRSNRNSAFRVGSGGEKHSFHTLNGDIYVRKADR